MSMLTNKRAGPINKSVLLFSGGMDSLCYAHLLKPDVLLYVPSHAVYTQQETRCICRLEREGVLNGLHWCDNVLNLSQWERDDLIVPNRNAHLILLASNQGDTIWLASVDGDRSCDKDLLFYQHMQALLDHMWQAQHWTAERKFVVDAPFKNITKRQLVSNYLADGGEGRHLLTSYSCYEGREQHCGMCKPCARKRVALELNGIYARPGYWVGDFWHSDWWPKLLPLMQQRQYRGEEDWDFMDYAKGKKIPGCEDWHIPHSDDLTTTFI